MEGGYNLYRRGKFVGRVAALDPIAERTIPARFLSAEEYIDIADRLRARQSIRAIAAALGRAPSTISGEIRRHDRGDGVCRPFEAQRISAQKRSRRRELRIHANQRLHDLVAALLKERWSPQQIAREPRAQHPDDSGMWLCTESIYQPNSTLTRPPIVRLPRRLRTSSIADLERCSDYPFPMGVTDPFKSLAP